MAFAELTSYDDIEVCTSDISEAKIERKGKVIRFLIRYMAYLISTGVCYYRLSILILQKISSCESLEYLKEAIELQPQYLA